MVWGFSVKLSFNGSKSIFMIFSSKRNLPPLSLVVDNVIVPRSSCCLYLGLTIDDKLNWNSHITKKCAAVKKLLFQILKCCRLSWGLSRDTVSLLYKSSFIPTILYNCSVWASATSRKKIVKSLKSAQRPFALIIGRLFKSTSTEAALVLANIIPLHLKVLEIVAKRSLSALSELLPGSSQLLVGDIPNRIRSAATPSGLSLRTHRERMIRSEVFSLWNSTWATATTGKQTRLFFPSVELAFILSSSKFPLFLCSFLSGHCILNDFLFKIKKSSSPSCSCLKGDETVHHVIFDCLEYATHRSALIMCATGHELSWPVPLSTFAQHKPMWVALIIFLRDIQRFL